MASISLGGTSIAMAPRRLGGRYKIYLSGGHSGGTSIGREPMLPQCSLLTLRPCIFARRLHIRLTALCALYHVAACACRFLRVSASRRLVVPFCDVSLVPPQTWRRRSERRRRPSCACCRLGLQPPLYELRCCCSGGACTPPRVPSSYSACPAAPRPSRSRRPAAMSMAGQHGPSG